KLTIQAFEKPERKGTPSPDMTFEAMFNPSTYSENYTVAWDKPKKLGGGPAGPRYVRTDPGTLSLGLVLDGHGVDDFGLPALERTSVREKLDKLLSVAYRVDGSLHEPRFLKVTWGKALTFDCRLSSLGIKYTAFDRDGSPLRAELTLELINDEEVKRRSDK